MAYDFGNTTDGEGFARYYASVEEKARSFMDAYYVAMDNIRRHYETAFMDIAHMGYYSPGTRVFLRPVDGLVEIYYEAFYASGVPYIEQVGFESMDSVPAEIDALLKACEKRQQSFIEHEEELFHRRANARREALLERIAHDRKELADIEDRISPSR